MNTEITRETLRSLNEEAISNMNKATLIEYLSAAVNIINVQSDRGPGRKDDVLAILQNGPAGILEIAEKLNITSKNVSSQLSYLRKEGYIIHTDEKSRKYLAAAEPVRPQVEEITE